MHIEALTLDDLIRDVFEMLIKSRNQIRPTQGEAREECGVLLELSNPRARLSLTETKGSAFSCLGEFLWYLAYSDDREFIGYYIPFYKKLHEEGQSVSGAYGPRLVCMRGHDQIKNVIDIIREPDSRRAVIQLFNAEDISQHLKDTPCTCTLQFLNRGGKLHMLTNMRSNDAFLGLPHDVFAFTMMQEVFARTVGVEVGVYKHVVGSLHLYERDIEKAKRYLCEGWQSTNRQMPEMPAGDPWPQIGRLLEAEVEIRRGCEVRVPDLGLTPYWADLVRLLQIFSKKDDGEEVSRLKSEMWSDVYRPYIERREPV